MYPSEKKTHAHTGTIPFCFWSIFLRNYKFLGVPFNENSPIISPISIKMYKNDRNIKLILDKPQNHSPNPNKMRLFLGFFYLIYKSTKLLPSPKFLCCWQKNPRSIQLPEWFPALRLPAAPCHCPRCSISNDETWQSLWIVLWCFLPPQGLTWNLKMARPAIGDSCWKNMVHLKMARPASRRFLLETHHFFGVPW